MAILMNGDWEFIDIEKLTHERDQYQGQDTVNPSVGDLSEHAGEIELGADQYIVCAEDSDIFWPRSQEWDVEFEDLIKTKR